MTLILQGTDNSVSSPAVQGGTAGTTTGVYYPATNQVALATNGTLALIVNTSQNVGLNVTPSDWFALQKNIQIGGNFSGTPFAGALASQTNDAVTSLFNNAYINTSNADTYYSSGSNEASKYRMFRSNHEWYSAPAGVAGGAITFTKVLGVTKDASLALQGASSQTGTGITFPATQSASSDANTLDDYEEGTWTPSIQLASSSASYPSTRNGSYTKIGNCVYFWGNIVFTASAGITITNITGLPFNTNGYTSWYPGPAMTNFYFVDLGSGGTMLGAYYNNGANSMHLHCCGNNTNQLAPLTTSNTMELRFEGHYTTT